MKLGGSYLTLYDLYALSLPADLVSLSACVTGRSVVAAGDELHVGPVEAGVVERPQRGLDAVLVERSPPLAPLVHPNAQDRDRRRAHPATSAVGFQRQMRCGTPSTS